MTRSCALILTGLLAVVLPAATSRAADDARPNVLVVLTDDQGYGDLSAHGNPVLETPNLDRLHGQSVRLTDFHVAPKCTPTRGQLMTGLDAMRNGATRVCQGRSMMRRELPTMADIFHGNGYRTGHFGKWHLGDSYPHRPQDRGFDETVHHGAWGITSIADHPDNDYWDDVYRHNGRLQKYEGYCTDVWFEQAMQWMEARQGEDEPFFCYLATNCPHAPNRAPERFVEPYRGKPGPAEFYGQIANIDMNMGRLLKWMERRGLAENTILIFMGDNGSARGSGVFNAGMRGRKGTYWEGGHRVPFFIRWPGGDLGQPRDIDELTQVQDVLPTLIELCGLEVASRTRQRFDGTSLAGLLRGTQDKLKDRMLVVQIGRDPQKGEATVMWDKWRLVKGRLYNLEKDPHQDRNVAKQHPEVAAKMRKHYERWWKGVQEPFHETRWIHLGSRHANPTMLYSSDWDGDYADNRANLIAGDRKGTWHVRVERDGLYEFTLYRWWPLSDKTLAEAYDPASSPKKRFTLEKGANLSRNAAPRIRSAPLTLEAVFEGGEESGVLVAQGGKIFGYALYVADGRLRFALRNEGRVETFGPDRPLPRGEVTAKVELDDEARVRMTINGEVVAEGQASTLLTAMPRDGLQVGRDNTSGVGKYSSPNPYRGAIDSVNVRLKDVHLPGAVPIASASLSIGDTELKKGKPKDKEGAKSIRFTTRLEAGEYDLRTMFYDEDGRPLCGAYYIRVERK